MLDAGFEALKAGNRRREQGGRREGAEHLARATTIAGKVDFTSGPVANVSPGPIIGTQWVPAKEGSKFKFDYVVTENATDPNVPVESKLVPYNG